MGSAAARWRTRKSAASSWQRVSADLAPYSQIEQNPLMEGRQMVMVFGPKKK